VDLIARGRHDPCVVPRAVPMVEAMVAIVLADQLLRVRHAVGLCIVCTSCTSTSAHVQHHFSHCARYQLRRVQMSCASPGILPTSTPLRHSLPYVVCDTPLLLQANEISHVRRARAALSGTADCDTRVCSQHVAQCEVLPRGEGPSPDARVNTQLRVPVQPAQTLEHLTAAV